MLCGHQAIVRELDNTTLRHTARSSSRRAVFGRAEPFDKIDGAVIGLGKDSLSSENTVKNSSALTPAHHMQGVAGKVTAA